MDDKTFLHLYRTMDDAHRAVDGPLTLKIQHLWDTRAEHPERQQEWLDARAKRVEQYKIHESNLRALLVDMGPDWVATCSDGVVESLAWTEEYLLMDGGESWTLDELVAEYVSMEKDIAY